jgi:hypothetical protein
MKKETTKLVFLGRTELIKKAVLEVIPVDLGDGFGVHVKEMSAEMKNDYEASLLDKKKDSKGVTSYTGSLKNVLAKLVVYTACDEKGKLIFKPEEAATISQNMLASTMDIIGKAAKKLNKLEEEDKEDIVKN